jgi:hypothetical protein
VSVCSFSRVFRRLGITHVQRRCTLQLMFPSDYILKRPPFHLLIPIWTCDNVAIDTASSTTYRMRLIGSPLLVEVSQQGTRCESGAAPQR